MKRAKTLLSLLVIASAMLTGCTENTPPKPAPPKGYTVLEDWVTMSDFVSSYVSPEDETDILVLPINIPDAKRSSNGLALEWDEYWINEIEDVYCNKNSQKTFAVIPYFTNASFGKKEFNNYVAPVYEDTKYTQAQLESSYSYVTNIIVDALVEAQKNYGEGFEERFDKNGDGLVDALNVITNIYGESNTSLWPHSAEINTGKNGYLKVGRYTLTNTPHCAYQGYNVIIHELSHTFGIDDYYDYDYSGVSYIGSFDMQESNEGDWNAFSKFTVGWGTPYVVNGEADVTTITVGSQNLTGEYIVIPADYFEFEDSPFNEYFILELITDDGNNEGHIEKYIRTDDGGSYGARLSHANGTLCKVPSSVSTYSPRSQGQLKTFEDALDLQEARSSTAWFACNNTKNGKNRPGVSGYDNFPLLAVIEADNNHGFTQPTNWYDRYLSESDLFYTGDEFTFDKYSSFIVKDGKSQETMNNELYFPYSIYFDEVGPGSMTVTITYNY